jgi:hypothetical protein
MQKYVSHRNRGSNSKHYVLNHNKMPLRQKVLRTH